MNYKSKDIPYMQQLKTAIYRLEEKDATESCDSWEHIRRYTVIEDLMMFVRNAEDNPNPFEYNYNANLVDVDYLFITNTEHPKELEVFNAFIRSAGVTNFYRTSYTKSKSPKIQRADSLTSALKSELGVVKPKNIIIFGGNITEYLYGEKPIAHTLVGNTITTSSIIQVLQSDKPTANKLKNLIWSDFNTVKNL